MSFTSLPLLTTGDWIDAAWGNTYWRDNLAAVWPYDADGQLAYSVSPNGALSRLSKPSVDSVLKNTSAGVPSWLALNQLKGALHASAKVDFYPNGQTTTSASYVDVTGGTVNIVTTVTCTILMYSYGMIANGTIGISTHVRGVIGGTADTPTNSLALPYTSQGNYVPYGYLYRRTGVAAGTIACKMQFRTGNAANTAYYDAGAIIALAFVD